MKSLSGSKQRTIPELLFQQQPVQIRSLVVCILVDYIKMRTSEISSLVGYTPQGINRLYRCSQEVDWSLEDTEKAVDTAATLTSPFFKPE